MGVFGTEEMMAGELALIYKRDAQGRSAIQRKIPIFYSFDSATRKITSCSSSDSPRKPGTGANCPTGRYEKQNIGGGTVSDGDGGSIASFFGILVPFGTTPPRRWMPPPPIVLPEMIHGTTSGTITCVDGNFFYYDISYARDPGLD